MVSAMNLLYVFVHAFSPNLPCVWGGGGRGDGIAKVAVTP